MSEIDPVEQLAVMVEDIALLADEHPPDDLAQQVSGLRLARKLRKIASQVASDYEAALCADRDSGDLVEEAGAIVQIRRSKKTKGWDHTALREDIRPRLLFDEGGDERTGSQVLELLWDSVDGLQPLNQSMRLGVLRSRWGMEADEYAKVELAATAQFMAGADV